MSMIAALLLYLASVQIPAALGRQDGYFGVLSAKQDGQRLRSFCVSYNSSWGPSLNQSSSNYYPLRVVASATQWCGDGELEGSAIALRSMDQPLAEVVHCAQQAGVAMVILLYTKHDEVFIPCVAENPPALTFPLVVMSQDSGNDLLNLTSRGLLVSVYNPSVHAFDPGQVLLWLIAVCAVVCSSILANPPYDFLNYGLLLRKGEYLGESVDEGVPARKWLAILSSVVSVFVLVAVICGLLILLYLFFNPMVYVVIALFACGAAESLYAFLSPWVAIMPLLTCRLPANKLPVLRYRPDPKFFLIVLFCVLVSVCWVLQRKADWAWFLHDLLGFMLIVFITCSLKSLDTWVISLILVALFFYDIIAVFITPLFTSDHVSVMEKVVTGASALVCGEVLREGVGEMLPIVLTVPKLLPSPLSVCSSYGFRESFLLGYGDVAIPSLLVSVCLRFDRLARPSPRSFRLYMYFFISSVAYMVGLTGAFLASSLSHAAQPALLYIVPCTLGSVAMVTLCRGEHRQFFGRASDPPTHVAGQSPGPAPQQRSKARGCEAGEPEMEMESDASGSEKEKLIDSSKL